MVVSSDTPLSACTVLVRNPGRSFSTRFSTAQKISSSSFDGVNSVSPASTRAPQSANMVASPPSSRIMLAVVSLPQSKMRTTRSEEHTSELQSLMRISYAVFCLKKKQRNYIYHYTYNCTQMQQ